MSCQVRRHSPIDHGINDASREQACDEHRWLHKSLKEINFSGPKMGAYRLLLIVGSAGGMSRMVRWPR
ncbi:hypothetical protein MPNT_210034 [Candidatus Methylacidithermus pantelleriae]|uniref:Uncharacterized protein n=1 Tax=Candidatus Methylacidithermus pantelleriae TaxID=2744239 RepID=A0A8J2FSL3_9BACT|nr:hypothetical protein MPNT_210034 [Candidatus Methylacidithermus pantelleriae]